MEIKEEDEANLNEETFTKKKKMRKMPVCERD